MTAIGYAKIGRSITLDPSDAGFAGDQEAPQLLLRLACRNPDVTWLVVGRNRGWWDAFPPNVRNLWKDAAKVAATLPVVNGEYKMPWPVKWAGPPHITMSEQSGFEDAVVSTIKSMDGMVVHLGQHGTSNISIPESEVLWDTALADPGRHMTNPQDWSKSYARFLVRGLNALGDRTNGQAPVVWICTDPRNYEKARDLKWVTGTDDILAQYEMTRNQRHERYRDPRLPEEFGINGRRVKVDRNGEIWVAKHTYRFGGLELMILPGDWPSWGTASWANRLPAGVATTSQHAVKGSERRRSQWVRDFLLQVYPTAEVFGKWDAKSLADVPNGTVLQNDPKDFPALLNRWRCTVSLPVYGSGWSVAKPYQCFAANVVCFMLGNSDDKGWVLPSRRPVKDTKQVGEVDGVKLYSVRDDWTEGDLRLARWLRIENVQEFRTMSQHVVNHEGVWQSLVRAQRNLLRRRWAESYLEKTIEEKLGL